MALWTSFCFAVQHLPYRHINMLLNYATLEAIQLVSTHSLVGQAETG